MPKPKKFSPLTAPLTRKDLRRELKATGRLAVGPEKRILEAERRTSRVQSRRIKDWFPQYGKSVQQAAQRTRVGYGQADASIAAASDQAQNYAEQLRQRLAQEAQADANLRGVQYDPSGSLVNAQSQLARINSANTLRGVTAAQGASQNAYLQDKRRIGRREMVEQLLREQQRRRSYTEDLRDLARRKSDSMIQEKGRLRDSERDYYLGLLAARGEKAARRMSRRESHRDRKFNRQQARKDRRFDKNESEKDRRDGGSSQGTSNDRPDREDIAKIMAMLRKAGPSGALAEAKRSQVIDELLLKDDSFSRREAKRAFKRYSKRHPWLT